MPRILFRPRADSSRRRVLRALGAGLVAILTIGGAVACGLLAEPATADAGLVDESQLGQGGVETLHRDFTRIQRDGTVRALPSTIWLPAGIGDASSPRHLYPLVLFSHGLHTVPADYSSLLTAIASAGYVVVAPAYPGTAKGGPEDLTQVVDQPSDARAVLDQVLTDSQLSTIIDADRIAALGHSAGGMTTIGMLVGEADPRLDAALIYAGNAYRVGHDFDADAPPVPMLFIHPDDDARLDVSSGRLVFDAVPWPAGFLTLDGGKHSPPFRDPSIQQYLAVRESTVAFLDWVLNEDAASGERLREDIPGMVGVVGLDDRFGPLG